MENLEKPLFLSKYINSYGPDRHTFIYFPSFSKSSARYHVSFKNGMTEKRHIEQSIIAYVIDARLPLRVNANKVVF